ncbi:MAG TPA: hypothetical protein VIW29_07510 [Polyangiaceae bacterium]
MRAPQLVFAVLMVAGLVAGASSTTLAQTLAAPTCGQQGRVRFDESAVLLDAAGRKLARFSGGESAVTLLAPPAPGSEVLRIQTGTGRGSIRIEGYLKAGDLRLFTTSDVPTLSNHIWISSGTRVALVGSSEAQVKIEKRLTSPLQQVFSATVPCGALTFSPSAAEPPSVPDSARTFLMKVQQLALYAGPAEPKPLTLLKRSPSVDSVSFHSTEQRAGFVHLTYYGEVRIDAWAKAHELVPLPRGDFAETWSGGYTLSTPPQLQLQKEPRSVRTSRDVALRLAANQAEKPVGVVEPDTDLYVMGTAPGWANVLPKSLHVLPAEGSFWVRASDLGL